MSASFDVIDRVLDPFFDCLTPEVAKKVADLRADTETQARLDELADKANEGSPSAEERVIYDRFLDLWWPS